MRNVCVFAFCRLLGDVWAIGTILAELVCLEPLFYEAGKKPYKLGILIRICRLVGAVPEEFCRRQERSGPFAGSQSTVAASC